MRRLIWTVPAERALSQIVAYYAEIDRDLATRIADAIEAAPGRLLDFPSIGSATAIEGVRRWRVRSLPYVLLYEADDDGVVVLDVYHTAQNQPLP